MQMFSEPFIRATKQRKDQPGRRQQTVVKHGDVDAFVQHIDHVMVMIFRTWVSPWCDDRWV